MATEKAKEVEGTTIVSLEASNVKRLRAVSIDASGKPAVIIGGRNEQGKSSVLDSIVYCLGGKPDIPQPIINLSFHCWCDLQGPMNPNKIIMGEVKGHSGFEILNFLAECIG